jgi:hypothetical protein
MSLTRSQIAQIHIAKKALDLDEDTYRDILKTLGGVNSSKDLDTPGFVRVMNHFRALGFFQEKKKFQRGGAEEALGVPPLSAHLPVRGDELPCLVFGHGRGPFPRLHPVHRRRGAVHPGPAQGPAERPPGH